MPDVTQPTSKPDHEPEPEVLSGRKICKHCGRWIVWQGVYNRWRHAT